MHQLNSSHLFRPLVITAFWQPLSRLKPVLLKSMAAEDSADIVVRTEIPDLIAIEGLDELLVITPSADADWSGTTSFKVKRQGANDDRNTLIALSVNAGKYQRRQWPGLLPEPTGSLPCPLISVFKPVKKNLC